MPEILTTAPLTGAKTSRRVSSENRLSPSALWVFLCAYLNGAGWMLSWMHALNATGYALALALGLAVLLVCRWGAGVRIMPAFTPARWRRRFRRPLAFGFLAIAALALPRLARGEADDLEKAVPSYGRPPDITTKKPIAP